MNIWPQTVPHKTAAEVAMWSELESQRAPADLESRKLFSSLQEKVAPNRDDIMTWFDLLDIDDYVSFGGKA